VWLKDYDLKPKFLEKQLVSEAFHYGGTIDFYGDLDGVPTLLDFKTSSGIYDEHRFQVAAYWRLLLEAGYPVKGIRILQVPRDGGQPQEYRMDGPGAYAAWEVFEAALRLYEAKAAYKNK
jgi:hypothetical protein